MKTTFACVAAACVALSVAGCGSASKADTDAAREFVRSVYSNPAIDIDVTCVEEPEYAAIPKIPQGSPRERDPRQVRGLRGPVWFTWRDENRTTHDDMVVWVTSDHKAVAWSSSPDRDNWRKYVRSLAKQ